MTRSVPFGGATGVTTTSRRSKHAPEGPLSVLIIGEGIETRVPLPDGGDAIIGRAADCDVRVNHLSVSRNHAVIHVGVPLTIEDLGSSNGTRVRGVKAEARLAMPFAPGEPIEVGSVVVVVQRRAATPGHARHFWTHADFEKRLEEECARARQTSGQFAVVRVRAGAPNQAELVKSTLGKLLREMDVLGAFGPADYELLLPDTTAELGQATRDRLVEELTQAGVAVRAGLASFPHDGRDAYGLLGRAAALVADSERERDPNRTAIAPPAAPAVDALNRLVERIAAGTINVLITGETGAGKEVLAAKIHKLSPRAAKPFLGLNCAALSETLLESELFGHERGAFTGAVLTKPGLLETADGGTIFLDEVGELPLSMQVKLLRVLEERRVLRVGALKPRAIDVRFLAATNRDLEFEIGRGGFRQDLYFRLNGITLVVPPLRERKGEILALAQAFLDEAAAREQVPKPRLADDAKAYLISYSWPGNVRELRNAVERALLLSSGGWIAAEHLVAARGGKPAAPPAPAPAPAAAPTVAAAQPLLTLPGPGRSKMPPELVAEVLARCNGNQTEAAKLLGVSRRTVVKWVEKYHLPRPRKR